MLVPLAAAAVGLAYFAAVPVKIAFVLRPGAGARFGLGIAAFEGRFARRAAEGRLARPRARRKKPAFDKKILKLILELLRTVRYLLRHAELDVRGRLGLGDAALTALACGSAGALAAAARAATGAHLRAEIAPDFGEMRPSGEITGIITLRAGHIMLAALIGAIDYSHGRLSAWTDTRSKTS